MAKKRIIPKLRPAMPSHIQHAGLILDSHEVRHALAGAVGEEIWYVMKNSVLFDNERYFESIHRNYDLFVKAKS
jgi:hypothetical protein